MKERYRSSKYDADLVVAKYATKRDLGYVVFEVDANSRTLRELWADRDELPAAITDECDKRFGNAFSQVKIE